MPQSLRRFALAALTSTGLLTATATPAPAAINSVVLPSAVDGEINTAFGFRCTPPFAGVPATLNSTAAGKLIAWSYAPGAFPGVEEHRIVKGANRVALRLTDISANPSGPLTAGRITVYLLPLNRYGLPAGGIVTRTVTLRCTTGIG